MNRYYLLNGWNVFISNRRIVSVFIVLTKAGRNLPKPSKCIAMFIVDADKPGVSNGKTEELMGRHCSPLDEIIFEETRVPEENLPLKDANIN
ncbi:MAG: acyl-CoA dehydrogenase family protein [Desulfobacterales bacterium]|nr:acyl-CoA dehydrogenase family protein [Desulfobacterales bacterium]